MTAIKENPEEMTRHQLLAEIRRLRMLVESIEKSPKEHETTCIAKRKQAAKELHDSRERMELAMTVANDGMWDWDLNTDVVFFDPIYYTMAGYDVNEFSHTLESFQQRLHPEDIDNVMETASRHLNGEIDRFVVEFRFARKDGDWMWILGRGKIVERDADGRPTRFIGTHTDITERKRAEEALRESEEKYRHLIQHSGEAIYLLYNRRFELINDKFQEMFEISLEDVNQPAFDFIQLVAEKSRPAIEQRILRQKAGESLEPTYEFTALSAGGREIEVEATVTYVKYKEGFATQGILRDVTENKRLESQLRQVQKMEAIGQLAGGVAHDFNNLLTVINGYSDMLLRRDLSREIGEQIEQIQEAGKRAARLTSQLLAFSRKQIIDPIVINLNHVIVDHLSMLSRLLGEDIQVTTELQSDLPNIKADPGQIEQVIMNIAINARDAMPKGGKMIIRTSEAGLKDTISRDTGTPPDRYVMMAVSDTGLGMDEKTKSRIFEPFFTTKGRDRGTGLGLATVYGIVKQNQGFIDVSSEPGQGTTLKVFLPCSEEGPPVETETTGRDPALRGDETILLVEDDDAVRKVTRDTLAEYGYTILTAANGEEALRLFREENTRIDLVLTDVVMPGMSCREMSEKMLARKPDLRIVFISGYADENIVRHGKLKNGMILVEKPFRRRELLTRIREKLDTCKR